MKPDFSYRQKGIIFTSKKSTESLAFKNANTSRVWQRTPLIPALACRGSRISEFEASLVYKVSSRTARAIQRNPVSKNHTHTKGYLFILCILVHCSCTDGCEPSFGCWELNFQDLCSFWSATLAPAQRFIYFIHKYTVAVFRCARGERQIPLWWL